MTAPNMEIELKETTPMVEVTLKTPGFDVTVRSSVKDFASEADALGSALHRIGDTGLLPLIAVAAYLLECPEGCDPDTDTREGQAVVQLVEGARLYLHSVNNV